MKRGLSFTLLVILLVNLCICATADGASWTCSCGKTGNTGNYCPNCGAPSPAPYEEFNGITANLLMRLSTRSGPGTKYDEPGTFFQNSWQTTQVTVLAKEWVGDRWWVYVDFTNRSTRYRAWTGLKRVDVDIDRLPERHSCASGTMDSTDTWYGPGKNYAKGPHASGFHDVIIFGEENGYVEVEYSNDSWQHRYRCWVPRNRVDIDPPSEPVG